MWILEQGSLLRLSCGRTGMRTLLLWFLPWRIEENGWRHLRLGLRRERANERLLWLSFSLVSFCSSNDRFLQNMEFIRFKKWIPRVVLIFRRGGSISQWRGFFVAKGRFRSPFRNCEMRLLCYEMALVCQRGVSQLRKFSQRRAWGCEMNFAADGRFHSGPFGAAKSFRRGPLLAAKFRKPLLFPFF